MHRLNAHEKKTILANLSAAIGTAETAIEGADIDGLSQAGEMLQRHRNLCMTQSWSWSTRDERRQTKRAQLVDVADRLLPHIGDEIKRREVEC